MSVWHWLGLATAIGIIICSLLLALSCLRLSLTSAANAKRYLASARRFLKFNSISAVVASADIITLMIRTMDDMRAAAIVATPILMLSCRAPYPCG